MKKIFLIIGIVLLAGAGILERMAAERVEVVELHTKNEAGEWLVTRLWVVDHEGLQYLRVGAGGSGWFDRLQASQPVGLKRGGDSGCYATQLRRDKEEQINALMQAKYTWGDSFIGGLFGGRKGSISIALHPSCELDCVTE